MSRGDPKMVFHLWAGEEACIVLAIYGRPVVLWVCANPPLDPAYFIPQAPPAIQRAAAAAARARYEGYLYLHSTRLNPRAGCGKRGSLAGRVLRRPVLTSVSVSFISLQLPGSVPYPGRHLYQQENSKASLQNVTKETGLCGLHFKSRALTNYLRRRSPGPPFPPDHRQAGERGATTVRQGNGGL